MVIQCDYLLRYSRELYGQVVPRPDFHWREWRVSPWLWNLEGAMQLWSEGEEMLESLKPLSGRGTILVCSLATSQYNTVPSLDQFQLSAPNLLTMGRKDTSLLLEGQYYLRLLKVSKPVSPLWRKHCCGVFRRHTVIMNNEYMILGVVFSSARERENNGSLFFLPGCSNEGKSKLLYQSYISANIF